MEVSNLYAFSNLLRKLFSYLGIPQLPVEDRLCQTIRCLRKKRKCGDLLLCVTQNDQGKVRLCRDNNTVFSVPEACTEIPFISKEWSIPIAVCSLNKVGIILNLNRTEAFKTVMLDVFSKSKKYGEFCRSAKIHTAIRYKVQQEGQSSDLSETRVVFGAKVVENLLQAVGHEVEINPQAMDKNQNDYYFTHKSTDDSALSRSRKITCGVVLNSETRCKETTLTASEYCRRWEDTISAISQGKDTVESQEVQSEINARIARAAVLFDLLGVKLSNCVSLRPPSLENQQCHGVSSKGAAFVLYNTARLASIMSQFSRKVNSGYYPELPPLDQVDMSLLTYEEEWTLLFDFIMLYPYIIWESLLGLDEGKPNVHVFVAFINAFCKEISSYYRRVRILTEPRSQLLPSMFARLYLLKSVDQVLHNALGILGIKPLLHM